MVENKVLQQHCLLTDFKKTNIKLMRLLNHYSKSIPNAVLANMYGLTGLRKISFKNAENNFGPGG